MGLLDILNTGIGATMGGQQSGQMGGYNQMGNSPYGGMQQPGMPMGGGLQSLVNAATSKLTQKMQNKTETFTFQKLPGSLERLQAYPEATLDTPYKTAALAMVTLTSFERNPEEMWRMLDWLNGPYPVDEKLKQFITERLKGKLYKVFSFFKGATPQNDYTPTRPFTIGIISTPRTFVEKDWATVYVQSGGVDDPRPIKLRHKPSTNQWFISEIQCLGDMRVPTSQDEWA